MFIPYAMSSLTAIVGIFSIIAFCLFGIAKRHFLVYNEQSVYKNYLYFKIILEDLYENFYFYITSKETYYR